MKAMVTMVPPWPSPLHSLGAWGGRWSDWGSDSGIRCDPAVAARRLMPAGGITSTGDVAEDAGGGGHLHPQILVLSTGQHRALHIGRGAHEDRGRSGDPRLLASPVMVGGQPQVGDQRMTVAVAGTLAALVIADMSEVFAQTAIHTAVAQDPMRALESGAQKAPVTFQDKVVVLVQQHPRSRSRRLRNVSPIPLSVPNSLSMISPSEGSYLIGRKAFYNTLGERRDETASAVGHVPT